MTICMVQVEGMETASLGFFFGSQPPTSQRTEFTLIGDALACSSRLLRYAIAVRYGTLLPCTGRRGSAKACDLCKQKAVTFCEDVSLRVPPRFSSSGGEGGGLSPF